MNWHTFTQYLLTEWQHTSPLEMIAVFFGICEVLLAYQNKIWLYPAGIISTGIFIWIYLQPKVRLYADAGVNSYYLAMSIYGWVVWSRRNNQHETIPISRSSIKEWLIALGIVLGAFVLGYFVLKNWTNSNTPMADAFVAATAWSGMWLLARRKIENWILLNISNAVAIPLYIYKHLDLTAVLTLFLFIVAVFGYLKWNKILNNKPDGVSERKRVSGNTTE